MYSYFNFILYMWYTRSYTETSYTHILYLYIGIIRYKQLYNIHAFRYIEHHRKWTTANVLSR